MLFQVILNYFHLNKNRNYKMNSTKKDNKSAEDQQD
jgi:hypothetical protein